MTMEPISEDEEETKGLSCMAMMMCCGAGPSSSTNNTTNANDGLSDGGTLLSSSSPPTSPSMDRDTTGSGRPRPMPLKKKMSKQHSIYESARSVLGEKELAALKEFEEAAIARISLATGGDESVYFDALGDHDEDDNNGPNSNNSNDYSVPSSSLHNKHQHLPYAPAQVADRRPRESISMTDPSSLLMKELKSPRVNVKCPGYPGNLTEKEVQACQKLRDELIKRKQQQQTVSGGSGKTYEDVVHIYHPVETEPYSLCRFLRARQFDVDKVLEMITEILDVWREAQKHNYFPDPNAALGAPVNVFLTQLPTIYSGCAKNGSPVAYAFAANVSVEGIECLTELDNIEQYSWYAIVHKFKQEIARAQTINPDVVRCETIQVIDLNGLNSSVLNKRTVDTLGKLVTVNKCFPEVLNSMVILNAPSFFSFFWRIIKAMLDPRTASKVEMFFNEQDGINWMLERIDKSELLSDYGGDGDSFEEVLNRQNVGGSAKRQVVKRFAITQRTNDKVNFKLEANESANFKAYTRSTTGAEFELVKDGTSLAKFEVKGSPMHKPFSVNMFTDVKGPGTFTIKSKGKASFTTDYFVVAGDVLDAN